jgi:hypothetical protein
MKKIPIAILDHWITLSSMSNPVLVFLPNLLIGLGFRLSFRPLIWCGSRIAELIVILTGFHIAHSIRDVLSPEPEAD